MTTPVVLFTADSRDFDGYTWHCAPTTYLEAVLAVSGGMPLILSAFGPRLDLDAVLDRVDGVVATGSKSNVHPSHYGVTATEVMGPYDEVRDATSLPLIRRTIERGIPLLCICRGLQELNVALGGTLASDVQDLPDRMDHRHPDVADMDGKFAIRHGVSIAPGGCLGRLAGVDAAAGQVPAGNIGVADQQQMVAVEGDDAHAKRRSPPQASDQGLRLPHKGLHDVQQLGP